MNTKFLLIPISLLLLLTSCDESDSSVVCSTIALPALTIEIIDKESGAAISCGAKVTVEDSNFSEQLVNDVAENCDDTLIHHAAYEREGIYDVHVSKTGYLDWSKYNITVTSDLCNVATVAVQVLLEK